MSSQNPQQGQEQLGPIAQQLVKMQVNGQQVKQGMSNGQCSPVGSSSHRSWFSVKELWEWLDVLSVLLGPGVVVASVFPDR